MAIDQEHLITCLLASQSVSEAAKMAECSRKTVYNYLQDESFQKRLEMARAERKKRIQDVLDSATVKAIDSLVDIMTTNDFLAGVTSSDRIKAAEILLRLS